MKRREILLSTRFRYLNLTFDVEWKHSLSQLATNNQEQVTITKQIHYVIQKS